VGASTVINCTYVDRTSYNFFWYKQGLGEHPKLIVDIHSNMERKCDEKLVVLPDKIFKHFSLHITDVQSEDSAMYFCATDTQCSPGAEETNPGEFSELKNQVSFSFMDMLPDTCSVLVLLLMLKRTNGDSVTQTEGLVTVTEGSPVMLNCTYQASYSNSFPLWYVQYLNKAPQRLLWSITDNKRTEHQGFHATLHKSNSSFHLQKSSVQLSDSALYYCALSDTARETAGEAAQKPKVQEG
ncbi:hypothetical protein U0070_016252, partial [Myodes glareolus]